MALLAVALAESLESPAVAQPVRFEVDAQPASEGIPQFARQAGIQILVAGSATNGRTVNAIKGRFEIRAALERLIAGTGLELQSFRDGVVILRAAAAPAPKPPEPPIVVTGSRILREPSLSAMPIRLIDMREAERFGRLSVHDALTQNSAVGYGIGITNAFGEGWDAGMASVSLRNLGANRSLTLIDGMRRVSGSARSSAVDINMIPTAMIERIEVITGGATAIYGADAVTGAVNIITKRRVDGLNISATGGLSQRADAGEFALSASTGAEFAAGRGSFAVGGTYSHYDHLAYAQRYATYLRSIANPDNGGADDGIPDQISVPDFRQIYFAYQPSFYFEDQSWLVENGTPRVASYDRLLYPGEFSYGDGGDGRNLRDKDQLRGGAHVLALLGRVDYALSDRLDYSGYVNVGWSDYGGTASFPLPRDDSREHWFNGAGGAVATLDNPYLPARVRQFMLDRGLNELPISRSYGNFPIMAELHDRRSLTVGQSLGGTLAGGFDWRIFHQYGRTSDQVRTTNIPFATRWPLARDVIADPQTGVPVCRDPAARAAGCVPLDIFSEAPPSDALKDYVLGSRREHRTNRQHVLGAGLIGPLAQLPAGPLSVALGVEWREESLTTRDDPRAATEFAYSGSSYTVHPDLDAAFDVAELYGELSVPLVEDRPLLRHLALEGAFRYSRYSTLGPTQAWKIGGTWSPIDGLMLRAMRSRSVRAPNFGELYEVPISKQTGSITDPCEAGDYYQSETRSANCRALGIDVPLGDFKVGPVITTGGNAELRPETSNSLTFGAVLRPAIVPGLVATLDYWDIGIDDVITQFAYTTVLNLCVDLPTIDNLFCRAVQRDPIDGHVTAIHTNQVNVSRMHACGIDIGLRWDRTLGIGRLQLNLDGTYLLQQRVESTSGVTAGNVRYEGDWENPRFQMVARTSLERGAISGGVNMRFISAGRYAVNAESNEVYDDNRLSPVLYVDTSASLAITPALVLTSGVRNLFDVSPPNVYPVYKDTTVYSNIGRFFYIGLKFIS